MSTEAERLELEALRREVGELRDLAVRLAFAQGELVISYGELLRRLDHHASLRVALNRRDGRGYANLSLEELRERVNAAFDVVEPLLDEALRRP